MLSIARLEIFNLIRRRARVPVPHREMVRRAVDRDPQVIRLARENNIERVDCRPEEQVVLIA